MLTPSSPRLAFYCTSTSWGGLEMNMLRLAGWMIKRGWDIIVYAVPDSRIWKMCSERSIRVQAINIPWKYGDIKSAWKVLSQLTEDKRDILWVFTNRDISVAANVKMLARFTKRTVKTIYLQQMGIGVNKRDALHTFRYKKLDAWITPLQSLAREITERTHFPSNRIHIVPLCIDVEADVHLTLTKEECRTMLAIPQDAFIIGIIGRLDPMKGQEFLIESLPALRARYPQVHLLIVGEATLGTNEHYADVLAARAAALGVQSAVHIRPFRNDVSVFYRAIDAFIMATRSETYGMVTLEALMHGTPVIGTNRGGTPDLLHHGAYGYLYEPNDTHDFIRAATDCIEHPDLTQAKSRDAQANAFKHYTHDAECEGAERVITTIMTATR